MQYLIGVLLAIAVCLFALLTRIHRDDPAFYPTVLIVVTTYYILFAVMANSPTALTLELLQTALFSTLAVVGFKKNPWLVLAGLFMALLLLRRSRPTTAL